MLGYKIVPTLTFFACSIDMGFVMKHQYRSSHTEVFCKEVFKEISQNSQENTCARVCFFFIKKETLAEVFSCEFCEISENTFPYRTPLVAASANNNTSFHLDYLQEKLMKTFFPKNPKNPIYLRFWGFFLPKLGQKWVLLQKTSLPVLLILNILGEFFQNISHCCQVINFKQILMLPANSFQTKFLAIREFVQSYFRWHLRIHLITITKKNNEEIDK